MKKIRITPILLVLILSLMFSKPVKSQHFLDTSSVWSIWYDGSNEGGGNIGFRVRLMQPVDSSGTWKSTILYSRNQNPDAWLPYFGQLKEDGAGKKIYMNSTLLYDFSIVAGDTFGFMKCEKVDSILMNGSYRHRWIFYCLQNPWPLTDTADIWVEGIGSIKRGLFYPGSWFCSGIVGNPFTELICFHQGVNLLYMDTLFMDCLKTSTWYPPDKFPNSTDNHWNYNYEELNNFGGINLGNLKVSSLKDTVIHGLSCRKYSAVTTNHLGQPVSNIPFYLRQTGKKIFYSVGGSFYELFDLGADAGYNWTSRNPYEIYGLTPDADSLTTYTVDSVYYEFPLWAGQPFSFRTLIISSSSGWKFKLPVREITGGRWFFFPGKWEEWTTPHPAELRCFYYYTMEPANTCYYFPCFFLSTGIAEASQDDYRFLTFNDHFEIEHNFASNDNITTCLYDIYGREIFRSEKSSQSRIIIPASNLTGGIYFVRLSINNKEIATRKVCKP